MAIAELFVAYGPWAWFVTGLVLLALELIVPGGYFLWLGAAGLVTGVLAFVGIITWPWQVTIFGALALVIVIGWTLVTRRRRDHSDSPFLNRRAERYVGHERVIDEPIKDGSGRLSLDDTIWRIEGPDLAAGTRVRITSAVGAVLKVEPVGS